ncbi:MAG: hypothetical protein K2X77_14280 [Candidatus Obscuribacterales bacterium]|nr:hypothetical protein [Candidatus Obscuribacterales bacterium]
MVEAQKVFKQFSEMERAFDPAVAELFAPNAVVKDVRVYQDGQTKTITWSGTDYKQVLRAGLPVAKIRNDLNTYSAIAYSREGANVRIKGSRHNTLKKYSGPFELVVAPVTANGRTSWKIIEEFTQSEP